MQTIHDRWNDSPVALDALAIFGHLSPVERDHFFWKNAKAFYLL